MRREKLNIQKGKRVNCIGHHVRLLPASWRADPLELRARNGLLPSAILQLRNLDHRRTRRFHSQIVSFILQPFQGKSIQPRLSLRYSGLHRNWPGSDDCCNRDCGRSAEEDPLRRQADGEHGECGCLVWRKEVS